MAQATDITSTVKNLHPLEIRILLSYKKGDELTIEKVEKELGFKPGNGNQAQRNGDRHNFSYLVAQRYQALF
jgi:hypothetical protein